MNNETIKQFTPITVEEAGEMLRENGWKPVEGLWFSNAPEFGYFQADLDGVKIGKGAHFDANCGNILHCFTCTEIDPCKAPDGCPEIEPWMAFIGTIPTHFEAKLDQLYTPRAHGNRWGKLGIKTSTSLHYGMIFAIDVRTEWAQEHFPEHCRIRNFQEPDAFEEFCEAWALDSLQYASPKWFKGMMKQAYELGQANPTK